MLLWNISGQFVDDVADLAGGEGLVSLEEDASTIVDTEIGDHHVISLLDRVREITS